MDKSTEESPRRLAEAWRKHERHWNDSRYVYAVVSRRSRGVSIGINLNPGKECNFNCTYCQVNRSIPPETQRVDLRRLSEELDVILGAEKDGSLYTQVPFSLLKPAERGIRDIAFSGDGEPTIFPGFAEAIRIAVQSKRRFDLNSCPLVLITNSAYLHKPFVRKALGIFDQNNGEIWAKLDAGTEDYFRKVNRPNVPMERILLNILESARIRPVVVQSLWLRMQMAPPPPEEVGAYCDRLNTILSDGGKLKRVQLYTIARDPTDSSVSPLTNREMDQIASEVRSRVPVPVEVFYSS